MRPARRSSGRWSRRRSTSARSAPGRSRSSSRRGRLELDRTAEEFIAATESLPFVHFLDLDPRIAACSVRMRLLQRDPADRFIAATAELLGAPLVTADLQLRESNAVATVW